MEQSLSDPRLQGSQRTRSEREKERGERPETIPIYPPGPNDRAQWTQLPTQMPQIEPSTCRVSPGASDRLSTADHRLRSIGNSVIPEVAARAFIELRRRFIKKGLLNDHFNPER